MNENTMQSAPMPMKWRREKSTRHIAEGAEGVFYIEESRRFGVRRFWVKYRSKKAGGKCFNMPPSSSLSAAKMAAEENPYWEDGQMTPEPKKEEPKHAFAPSREVKRWDMRY